MKNKVTLPELVTKLATATSTTKRMSELFLRELFATVAQSLAKGENVTIKDFGQFKINEANGLNEVVFKPSKHLAEILNQPFEAFMPIELDEELDDCILNELSAIGEDAEERNETLASSQPAALMPPPFTGTVNIDIDKERDDSKEVSPQDLDSLQIQGQAAEFNEDDVDDDLQVDASATADKIVAPVMQPAGSTDASRNENVDSTTTLKNNVSTNNSNNQFVKGIITGALGMLLVGLIAWLFMRPSQSAETNAPSDDLTSSQSADSVVAEPEAPKLVTDTTSATMYLSRIAKKHYGRAEFWVYIYEENKSLINDPNNIPPGTIVVIPPAEKYGIDANDSESVEAAKRKSFELFS